MRENQYSTTESREASNISSNKVSYDYCMVFANNEKGKKFLKRCVDLMHNIGIETLTFEGNQNYYLNKEIFVLLRVDIEKIRLFADMANFDMQFDDDKLQEFCENGGNEQVKITKMKIKHQKNESDLRPYQLIFGDYRVVLPESLYYRPLHLNHPFRELYRLKLINMMLEAKQHELSQKGSYHKLVTQTSHSTTMRNIQIRAMLNKGQLLSFFPLHNETLLEELEVCWLKKWNMPWREPIQEVKEYFGEKIGLYFLFTNELLTWQMIPAVVGLAFQLVVFSLWDFSHPVLPPYGAFICVWAIAFLKHWKRKEKMTQLAWGVFNYEAEEIDRAEFQGEPQESYIDGKKRDYFPTYKRNRLQMFSTVVLVATMCIVAGVVVGIYALRYVGYISQVVASIINGVTIQIFNLLTNIFAVALTNLENYRTQTEHEDALTAKVFAFQFFNSYSSFYYLAFIAQPLSQCGHGSCMVSLATNLGIIFGTNLIVGNALTTGKTWLQHRYSLRRRGVTEEMLAPENHSLTPPEKLYLGVTHDPVDKHLERYSHQAVLFGYSTIFIIVLPMATLFSVICEVVRLKFDTWTLLRLYQRPLLQGAQDIGTWQRLFTLLAVVAVATNAALIVFTMNSLDHYSSAGRFWIFIGFMAVCYTCQYLIEYLIRDEPRKVTIQLERNKYINRKVVNLEPDDELDMYDDDDDDDDKDTGAGLSGFLGVGISSPKTETADRGGGVGGAAGSEAVDDKVAVHSYEKAASVFYSYK